MDFSQIVRDVFITEKTGDGKKSLLLLDIDDTLLQAQNIFIIRKLPTDKKEVKLTPAQYAKENVTPENKKYYDYREFRDPIKVANSISSGLPIVSNLKIMDSHIKHGWDLGVLTARGMEDVVAKALQKWLKFRDDGGNLIPIGKLLPRERIFAVNTENKTYEGKTDAEKKRNVMQKLKGQYFRVKLLDDDLKTVKETHKFKKDKIYGQTAKEDIKSKAKE